MTNAIRIHLFLPFCMILFAVSGVLLHAAPIKKLPDEPEEPAPAVGKLPDEPDKPSADAEKDAKPDEAKPARTEAEALKAITDRLDRMIYPYKPLQRSHEPILNRALSDEVVPSWRLIYVKPFDKPREETQTGAEAAAGASAAGASASGAAANDDEDVDLKEDFAAITLIPVKSIRLSNALRLNAVGKPPETILQSLFFTKYGIMWRKLQTQYETFTLYLGATEEFHVFVSANISVIYTLFRYVDMQGGIDLISLLVDCLDIEDEDFFTNRFALVHLSEFGDYSIPALQRAIKRVAASGQPPIQQFLGLANIATTQAIELLNEATDSEDAQIRDAAFTALIGMPAVDKKLKHAYFRMVETRERIWPGFAAYDILGCAKELSKLLDAYYARPKSVAEFETVARARWRIKEPNLDFVHTRALHEITIASIRSGEIANSPQYRNVQETDATRNARLQVEDEKRIASAKEAILKAPQTDLSVCAGVELLMFTTKDKRVSAQYIMRVNNVGLDILRALPRQETLRYLDALIRYNESVPEAEKLSDIRARVGK